MRRIASKKLINLATQLTLQQPELSIVPETEDFPWFIQEFQKQLQALEARKELLLPNIKDNNESIAIFSDYGGESKEGKYYTYSFLICAWNQTGAFNKSMAALRAEAGLNNPVKEIAFKDFRYGPIKRALDKYLANLSNLVNGFLLTVVVEKAVGSVFGTERRESYRFITRTLEENGFGAWKPEVAEKLLRITHFSAYLLALLSRQGQKVIWMTDHDAIASSDEKFMEALKLFSNLTRHYCKHSFSSIGGAVPFEEKAPMFLDLLSAPDVVAGAVEHYLTRAYKLNAQPQVKAEADRVLRWLAGQGVALKRHTMIIRTEESRVVSGTLQFVFDDPNPDTLFVPVVVK